MDKTKKIISCLENIIKHCDRVSATIERFGNDCSKFEIDLDYFDSVSMNILQIGELANHLPPSMRSKYENIAWNKIIGQRNVVVHGYGILMKERIWETATQDIPELKSQIIKILTEFNFS